jgi:hypothetical protein
VKAAFCAFVATPKTARKAAISGRMPPRLKLWKFLGPEAFIHAVLNRPRSSEVPEQIRNNGEGEQQMDQVVATRTKAKAPADDNEEKYGGTEKESESHTRSLRWAESGALSPQPLVCASLAAWMATPAVDVRRFLDRLACRTTVLAIRHGATASGMRALLTFCRHWHLLPRIHDRAGL